MKRVRQLSQVAWFPYRWIRGGSSLSAIRISCRQRLIQKMLTPRTSHEVCLNVFCWPAMKRLCWRCSTVCIHTSVVFRHRRFTKTRSETEQVSSKGNLITRCWGLQIRSDRVSFLILLWAKRTRMVRLNAIQTRSSSLFHSLSASSRSAAMRSHSSLWSAKLR